MEGDAWAADSGGRPHDVGQKQMHLASMTCTVMLSSGVKIGMLKITTQGARESTPRAHPVVLTVFSVASRGKPSRGGVDLRGATDSQPAQGTRALASASY